MFLPVVLCGSVRAAASAGVPTAGLLLEDGGFFLLEDGGFLLLEA